MEQPLSTAKRHRSPSYPALPLRQAIDRARAFYTNERRSAANVVVAMKHWGYGPNSGRGRMTLAALLSFGLLKDSGAAGQRQVQLTDVALRILLDDRPDSADRAAALKEAAMTPKIYREVVSKWPALEVSDANLRHYLIFERKFNENAVPDFIKDLRDTVAFAKVSSAPDNGREQEEDEPLDEPVASYSAQAAPVAPPTQAVNGKQSGQATPPPAQPIRRIPGMRQEVFALAEGDVTIQWPEQLSPDSFQDFTDWLRILERKIKRGVAAPSPPAVGDLSDGADAEDL